MLLVLVLFVICHPAEAQNLIQNSSFESYSSLPVGVGDFTCLSWIPVSGSPDYFNDSASVSSGCNIPYTFAGTIPKAHEGQGCIGQCVYMDGWPNFREYFGYYFDIPLIMGETYVITMYILSSAIPLLYGGIGIDNFAVAFTTVQFSPAGPPPGGVINFTPQCVFPGILYASQWKKISFELYADSAYQYMTVGCFVPDSVQNRQTFIPALFFPSAYFYLDDVRVDPKFVFALEELQKNYKSDSIIYTDLLGRQVPFQKGFLIAHVGDKRIKIFVR